jgi:transcriptional regulator with XRE-family HTH domain
MPCGKAVWIHMDTEAGKAIRARMVEARKKAGLRQEDAAKALRVARQTISKWESGKGSPNIRELTELCALYDVTPDWIATGVETVPVAAERLLDAVRKKAVRIAHSGGEKLAGLFVLIPGSLS